MNEEQIGDLIDLVSDDHSDRAIVCGYIGCGR